MATGTKIGAANLPVPAPREEPLYLTADQKTVLACMYQGMTLNKTAKYMSKRNGHGINYWRRRVTNWLAEHPDFQEAASRLAQGNLMLGLGPASSALANRAARGNVNAIRLLFEASGFWNPKHVQEHTGEVKITLPNVPRPVAGLEESPPIDAEVVED